MTSGSTNDIIVLLPMAFPLIVTQWDAELSLNGTLRQNTTDFPESAAQYYVHLVFMHYYQHSTNSRNSFSTII